MNKYINYIYKIYKFYISRPLRAQFFLCSLKKKKTDNKAYLVTSYQIGDIVYALAYVRALGDRLRNEGKQLILIAPENRKSLIELYNIHYEIKYWDSKNLKEIETVKHFTFSSHHVKKGLKNDIYTAIAPCMLKDQKSNTRDCLTIIRDEMYRVPDAAIQYPCFIEAAVTAIPDFETKKDRIAIINPYSNAIKDNLDVFDLISEYLVSKGYEVFSNVIKGQIPAKGSKSLDCSIFEFYSICNQVPLVVSIRSGIIDFVISANTNFFVLYPEKRLYDGFYNIYTLKAWNTKNVVEEAIHTDNETTINKFKKFIVTNNL